MCALHSVFVIHEIMMRRKMHVENKKQNKIISVLLNYTRVVFVVVSRIVSFSRFVDCCCWCFFFGNCIVCLYKPISKAWRWAAGRVRVRRSLPGAVSGVWLAARGGAWEGHIARDRRPPKLNRRRQNSSLANHTYKHSSLSAFTISAIIQNNFIDSFIELR